MFLPELRKRPVSFIHSCFFFLSGSSFQNIRQRSFLLLQVDRNLRTVMVLSFYCYVWYKLSITRNMKHFFMFRKNERGHFYNRNPFFSRKIKYFHSFNKYVVSIYAFQILYHYPQGPACVASAYLSNLPLCLFPIHSLPSIVFSVLDTLFTALEGFVYTFLCLEFSSLHTSHG